MAGETPSTMSHVMLIRVGVELPSRLMLTGTEGLTVATFNSTLSIKRESCDQHYTQHKLHYMMTAHLVRTAGMFGWQ